MFKEKGLNELPTGKVKYRDQISFPKGAETPCENTFWAVCWG